MEGDEKLGYVFQEIQEQEQSASLYYVTFTLSLIRNCILAFVLIYVGKLTP